MAKKWWKVMMVAMLPLALPALILASQETPATPNAINWGTVALILSTGFLGFPVSAITEMLKRLSRKYLKLPDAAWVGYIAAAIACAVSSWAYLSSVGQGAIVNIIIATFLSWLVANGFYKETAKKPGEAAAAIVNGVMKDVLTAVRSEVSRVAVGQEFWKLLGKSTPAIPTEAEKSCKPPSEF